MKLSNSIMILSLVLALAATTRAAETVGTPSPDVLAAGIHIYMLNLGIPTVENMDVRGMVSDFKETVAVNPKDETGAFSAVAIMRALSSPADFATFEQYVTQSERGKQEIQQLKPWFERVQQDPKSRRMVQTAWKALQSKTVKAGLTDEQSLKAFFDGGREGTLSADSTVLGKDGTLALRQRLSRAKPRVKKKTETKKAPQSAKSEIDQAVDEMMKSIMVVDPAKVPDEVKQGFRSFGAPVSEAGITAASRRLLIKRAATKETYRLGRVGDAVSSIFSTVSETENGKTMFGFLKKVAQSAEELASSAADKVSQNEHGKTVLDAFENMGQTAKELVSQGYQSAVEQERAAAAAVIKDYEQAIYLGERFAARLQQEVEGGKLSKEQKNFVIGDVLMPMRQRVAGLHAQAATLKMINSADLDSAQLSEAVRHMKEAAKIGN